MPCEYEWLEDGLYRKFTGKIDTQYILKSNYELYGDDRFQYLSYVLNDFSEIDTVLLDEEDVLDIANIDSMRSRINIGLKVALVIANHPTQVALALTFTEFMEKSNYKCKVFLKPKDALSWLTSSKLVCC